MTIEKCSHDSMNNDNPDLYASLRETVSSALNSTLIALNSSITPKCFETITSAYMAPNSAEALDKLIAESSKNKNDAMTFGACMKNATSNYFLIKITETSPLSSAHLEDNSFLFGLCLSKSLQCEESDFKSLISHISNSAIGFIEPTPASDIQLFTVNDSKAEWFQWYFIWSFIPLLIVLIQILFVIFKKLPYLLFTRCISSKEHLELKQITSNRESFSFAKHFIEIENAFSLKENSEEVLNYKLMNSKISNESGLVYIKGLRGISVCLMIIGQVFIVLWKSPATIYSLRIFEQTIRNFRFSIVFFGVRYSPGILFSCSGFILIFKFMCFLDDKVEEVSLSSQKDKSNAKELETSQESYKSNQLNISQSSLSHNLPTLKKRLRPTFAMVLTFYLLQLHKYGMMLLALFFVKFTMYDLKIVITSITPIWEYLYRSIIKSRSPLDVFIDILLQVLCLNNFRFSDQPEKKEEILEVLWVVNNEIVFFVLTAVVIFIFYRLKRSINIFVLSFGLLLIVIRFILVFSLEHYYSTVYYTSDHYGKFTHNPINNYPSYLIGLYFGLINYVIQKGMTVKNAKEERKLYLVNTIIVAKILLRQSNKATFISAFFIFLIIVLLSMSQALLLLIFGEYLDFVKNVAINVFYLLDTEIVVILIHYVLFSLFIKGENVITNVISADIWTIPHKMYFSVMLVMMSVIYYFFYQSESRMFLWMSNVLFYSLILLCLIFFFSFFVFILFEVPYKRLIRFLTHLTKDNDAQQVDIQESQLSNVLTVHYNE